MKNNRDKIHLEEDAVLFFAFLVVLFTVLMLSVNQRQ